MFKKAKCEIRFVGNNSTIEFLLPAYYNIVFRNMPLC